jgi:pyruvate,orthophosphate dikinase
VNLIRNVAEKVFSEMGTSLSYKVGTMIEVPRAALIADEVILIFLCLEDSNLIFNIQ